MKMDSANAPGTVVDEITHHDELVRERRSAAILLGGLTAVLIASVFYTPSEVRADGQYFTLCAFKILTSLPCPGCGLTHSFCALGSGRLSEAFRFNLLGPLLFLCVVLVWLRSLSFLLRWESPVRFLDLLAERFQTVRLFVVCFILFGVARIVYLLVDDPALLTRAPVFKAISGMFE